MARISYRPYDLSRVEQAREEKAARKAARDEPIDWTPPDERFGRLDPNDEEFESTDALAEYLFDEERETYTCHELQCVWSRADGLRIQQIRSALAEYGLTLEARPKEHRVRGFQSNSHNRYAGNPMSGGGGGGSIYGMTD